MMRSRPLAIALAFSVGTVALAFSEAIVESGETRPVRPDLPASVLPVWKLTSYNPSAIPLYLPYPSSRDSSAQNQSIPKGLQPACWQANYLGRDVAQVRVCRYRATSGAFDAWQRVQGDARTVRLQEGEYLVLVQGNNAPKEDLAALMRAIQSTLR